MPHKPVTADLLDVAEQVICAEADAVDQLKTCLRQEAFSEALQAIFSCRGDVICTGVGKAGIIGMKISATLASTGTPSQFLHPVEAVHGDLGRIRECDLVLALSHSGDSEEIIRLINPIKQTGNILIAMTGQPDSTLARHADVVLGYGRIEEACPHGLAPSASTTCMLALGDALALTVMRMRQFGPEDFARFHPAGNLGRKLMRAGEAMTVKADRLPVVRDDLTCAEALAETDNIPRRPGAMLLVDETGRLTGIFSDADLRRRIHRDGPSVLDTPIREIMTSEPKKVSADTLVSEALNIFRTLRIDELPVVDAEGKPMGLLDIQDLTAVKLL